MVIAIRQKIYYENKFDYDNNDFEFAGKFKDFDIAIKELKLENGIYEINKDNVKGIYISKANIDNIKGINTDLYYTLIELDKITENAVIGLMHE